MGNKCTPSQGSIDIQDTKGSCDNQASLRALGNPETKSDLVRETKIALNKLGHDNCVKLNWIEAHKGWHYNEEADKLAKKGCDPSCSKVGIVPGPNKKSIFNEIEKSTHQGWILRWKSSSDYRQSKYFLLQGISQQVSKVIIALTLN